MPTPISLHITALDQTRPAFASVKKNIDGAVHHLRSLKTELFALVGVAGFGALIEHTLEAGASIEKLSKQLGTSSEALSQFKHVAALSHVPFESLTRSWQLLEKNVSLAARGLGPATSAFQELGLSASRLQKLKVEEQFSILADRFTALQNAADRTRLAMALFGKSGAAMIPLLAGGSKALQAARLEADRLGLTLSETSSHQMGEAHEAIVRLKSALMGVVNTLAIGFGPALASAATLLAAVLPSAIRITQIAFLGLKETALLVIGTVVTALEQLYRVLGHLPAALGRPFEEASQAAKTLREDTFAELQGTVRDMAQLRAESQRGIEIGPSSKDFYDPALQALALQTKASAASKQAAKALEKSTRAALTAQEKLMRDHVEKVQSILSSGLFSFMENGFKGMVGSFKNSLLQIASDAAATEITGALFSSSKKHGLLGTLGNVLGSVFGGFRAEGGPVLPGRSYIVGERGPELLIPQSAGQIVPHRALTSNPTASAGLPPISVVIHVQTPDAASFKQASGQVAAAFGLSLQQAVRRNT